MLITLVQIVDTPSTERDRVRDGPETLSLWRTMASDRRPVPGSAGGSPQWTTVAFFTSVLGGGSLGTDDRSSLERFIRAVPLTGHLLATAS